MNIRAITALIMGLLLQWSMVQTLPDVTPAKSCETGSETMACCASKNACPCVMKEGGSSERPAPLSPTSPDLKLVFIGFPTAEDSLETAVIVSANQVSPHARAGSTSGFPGVPLSVAFCSFVI